MDCNVSNLVKDRVKKLFNFADIICDITEIDEYTYRVYYKYNGEDFTSLIPIRCYLNPRKR